MANAEQRSTSTEEPLISADREEGTNWIPMAMGAALVIVVVALIIVFTRNTGNPNQANDYASQLKTSNLHMATAENFAGGTVTYIQGTLSNSGDKKVTAARVEVIFRNSLGEITQKEVVPVMILLPNSPYVDYGPLERAPLGGGQSRDFRLTLEHITADWDGQIPQVKMVNVSTG